MLKIGFGLTSVSKTGQLSADSGCWCKLRDMVFFNYFPRILQKPLFTKKDYIQYQTLKY